jgi:hypothetical protein
MEPKAPGRFSRVRRRTGMAQDDMETGMIGNPVEQAIEEQDVTSGVTVAGHPLHAMSVHFPIALVIATLGVDLFYWWSADPFWLRVGLWSSGFAFATGVGAGSVASAGAWRAGRTASPP